MNDEAKDSLVFLFLFAILVFGAGPGFRLAWGCSDPWYTGTSSR